MTDKEYQEKLIIALKSINAYEQKIKEAINNGTDLKDVKADKYQGE